MNFKGALVILNRAHDAVLAQQVEHFHGKEEVGSSNLLNGFKIVIKNRFPLKLLFNSNFDGNLFLVPEMMRRTGI